jgi:simple sugar transport system ATP-binding protein
MSQTPAVEFKKVSKFFDQVKANSDLSFAVTAGSIHGIIGENGAGKSTAMKILFGLYKPDDGEVLVHGKSVEFKNPIEAMSFGIGMVHQHFMLAEPLSALDNILLQQKGGAFSKLPRLTEKKRLQELAHRYGFDINLDAKIEDLPVGVQQRIEILKILAQDSQILILDEPTAVLTPQEVQELFKNLRTLKNEGRTILIITHKLKEVMTLTDEVTVFRAGHVVAQRKTADTSAAELAELMVGRRLQNPSERKTAVQTEKEVLNLEKVCASLGNHQVENIDLKIHAKEIVGIAGVEGNGQDILIRTILDQKSLNKETFTGEIKKPTTIGAFPEDRLRFGVMPTRPVFENFLLGRQRLKKFCRGIFLNKKAILSETNAALKNYDVRPQNAQIGFEYLSGGNQQKLVVARALAEKPEFILAAQPTRGVDIGAIEFIHNQLRDARDGGAGILLISSELDELMALSDRIVVLYKGHLVAEFSKNSFDEIKIGAAMGGHL